MNQQEYTVRKKGDNYGLYFYGELLEVFATKETALKHKAIAENARRRFKAVVEAGKGN